MSVILNGTTDGYSTTAPTTVFPFAFSAWFKPTGNNTASVLAHSRNTTAGAPHYLYGGTHSGGSAVALSRVNTVQDATSTNTYNLNQWNHFLAVFYSSSERRIWLNGTGGGQNLNSQSPVWHLLTIGFARYVVAGVATHTDWFAGKIAESAVWIGTNASDMNGTDAAALANFQKPDTYSPTPDWYQPFLSDINAPESIGNAITSTFGSPTFDAADHPIGYFKPFWACNSNVLLGIN